jgi:ribosomal protein L11 methyltransferase
MSVVECKFAVAQGASEVIEEQVALLEDVRWTVWEDRIANHAWVMGYFNSWSEAKAASRRLAAAIEPGRLVGEADWRELADADWANSYKAHFKAWHIGRRYWVPEWERGTLKAVAGREIVWLDPGMAFGTGNHESTRLCCERLVEYIDAHKPRTVGGRHRSKIIPGRCEGPGEEQNQKNAKQPQSGSLTCPQGLSDCAKPGVIDAGCGSGILGISAFRFGLSPVIGFDNDPIAVRVSRENAVLNEVGANVQFFEGDLSSGLAGRQAGLVLANIHTDILRKGAKELVGAVAPGGWLALSGILAREVDGLRADFLVIADNATAKKSEQDGSADKPGCRATRGGQHCSSGGWKALSRRLGEWADLLLIRGQ